MKNSDIKNFEKNLNNYLSFIRKYNKNDLNTSGNLKLHLYKDSQNPPAYARNSESEIINIGKKRSSQILGNT